MIPKKYWLEVIGKDGSGERRHYLVYSGRIVMSIFDSLGWGIQPLEIKSGEWSTLLYAPMDGSQSNAVWFEKPTEPYFKDGWPEWEVIGGEGSA
jgi:hypothetical protein